MNRDRAECPLWGLGFHLPTMYGLLCGDTPHLLLGDRPHQGIQTLALPLTPDMAGHLVSLRVCVPPPPPPPHHSTNPHSWPRKPGVEPGSLSRPGRAGRAGVKKLGGGDAPSAPSKHLTGPLQPSEKLPSFSRFGNRSTELQEHHLGGRGLPPNAHR